MKIFVGCQKDQFNASCNAMQKKYEMGQALIDAIANKEDIILVIESHRDGNYCKFNSKGWELIDELQAVINELDDAQMMKIIAIEAPSLACFSIITAVNSKIKENMEIEFIGPLLEKNIFHNIVLVRNACPNAKIVVSNKRCGCKDKNMRDTAYKMLTNMGVIIKDL